MGMCTPLEHFAVPQAAVATPERRAVMVCEWVP